MSNIVPVPIDRAQLPQSMLNRRRAGQSMNQNLAIGVSDAFPLLSIKGKVFRARIDGEETPFIDPTSRTPVPYLDLIIVNGAPNMSKTYYQKGFEDGDLNQPDCWSLDAVRPDPSVAQKVSPTCANCPMNAFGTARSQTPGVAGKGKACADTRRVVVMMPHELAQAEPRLFLLRIPTMSLKNLKGYALHLERYDIDTNACITRLTFDYNEAYPKLNFNFVAPLDDASYQLVEELAESARVRSMLLAPDFSGAPSSPGPANAASQHGYVPQQGPILGTDLNQTEDAGRMQPNTATQHVPAQGPILDQTPAQQTTAPVQQKAEVAQPATQKGLNIKQLPDGKWLDMDTMTYVDPPKAKTVELDPTTIKLPDGRYYNPLANAFVVGPEKGAAVVGATEVKQEAKVETKAEAPAKTTKTRQAKAKAETQTTQQQAAQPVQNGTDVGVEDLPDDMENALQALLPSV